MLEGYYLRRPTDTDLNAVLQLMIACDVRDVGFPDSDEDDLRSDWDRIDLERDAWLVFDKHHQLQGYGAVLPWNNGKFASVYDAPGTEHSDLFLALSILCEGRARFLLESANDPEMITIAHYISDRAEYQKKILTEAGYSLTKFLFNMHRDLDAREPVPEWPSGYLLRTVKPESDTHELHALIQDAFDHPGRKRKSFNDWKDWMMHPPVFIPDIWFILVYQGQIVGSALCFEYESMGWVRQLAVRQEHRGKGLGRKLLQHAFSVFSARGFSKVGLAVEAENLNALNLYQNAGMRKAVHLNEYAKKISI
jgi:mycothiol synthase